MRRDVLLLEEMIEAAVQAVELVEGVAVEDLAADRIRPRDGAGAAAWLHR